MIRHWILSRWHLPNFRDAISIRKPTSYYGRFLFFISTASLPSWIIFTSSLVLHKGWQEQPIRTFPLQCMTATSLSLWSSMVIFLSQRCRRTNFGASHLWTEQQKSKTLQTISTNRSSVTDLETDWKNFNYSLNKRNYFCFSLKVFFFELQWRRYSAKSSPKMLKTKRFVKMKFTNFCFCFKHKQTVFFRLLHVYLFPCLILILI